MKSRQKPKIFIISVVYYNVMIVLVLVLSLLMKPGYSWVLLSSSWRGGRVTYFTLRRQQRQQQLTMATQRLEYDIVVIGAGASGMFAAGTASIFGCKTLLVDKHNLEQQDETHDHHHDDDFYLGGDCTNAACVPSKAIRCAARIAAMHQRTSNVLVDANMASSSSTIGGGSSSTSSSGSGSKIQSAQSRQQNQYPFSSLVKQYSQEITNKVRSRESPDQIASMPNLNIIYSPKISFLDSHHLTIENPYLFNSTFSNFLLLDDQQGEENDASSSS